MPGAASQVAGPKVEVAAAAFGERTCVSPDVPASRVKATSAALSVAFT